MNGYAQAISFRWNLCLTRRQCYYVRIAAELRHYYEEIVMS